MPLSALPPFVRQTAVACRDALARHPRRVAGGVLGLLGSFAITAFGIAPLAPDAAQLPQRLIEQQLQVPGLSQQVADLAEHPLELHRSLVTRGNETADTLLKKLGVADPTAAAFLRADRDARRLFDGRPGKMLQARTGADGALVELVARFAALDAARAGSHFTRLKISRANGVWRTTLETAPLVAQVRLGSGTVRSSLWAATDDARLPDAIAAQLIEIFSGDVDFHRQLKKGDAFSLSYETLTADDQPITWDDSTGRVLAAEFVNNGRALQALWFPSANGGKGGYFGPDGRSRKRAFLASPLAFSRVTSGFAMRFHPILQNWRAHNGVDYSAPHGTPVLAVGDGVVELAGRQSGYGNLVQLQHGNGRTTVYAHLSRMDVRTGQRVSQGQTLGAVGATGWATGPHLHFEFRVNGQFQDPLQLARETEQSTVDSAGRPQFQRLAALAARQLEAAQSMSNFRGDAE